MTVVTRVQTHAGNIAPVAGYQELSEGRLLASAKRGQKNAFGELGQPHMKKILETARRITKNREDAVDAIQDSVVRAFLHIKDHSRSSFQGGGGTWKRAR
jgi:RNA polymerase sigma-70 factor (ECF subfamily)